MTMLFYLCALLLPLALSLLITPRVIQYACKIGAVDLPGERKVHKTAMPRIGGLAIFISFSISAILLHVLLPELRSDLIIHPFAASTVVMAFCGMFILGYWDDLYQLRTSFKFSVQVAIACLIYAAGFKISNITHPLGTELLNVEVIDFPLTLIWIVGITNAFNLIDGLDGLAAGIGAIASFSIFVASAISGAFWYAVLALILFGSVAGFLKYNFSPAKIFLGDSGSLMIGFSLALLSIQSTTKITTGLTLLFPLLVLGVPIADTLLSMIRRFLSNYLPGQANEVACSFVRKLGSIFKPDKSHIHHRLMYLGLTHRNSVLLLYGVSAFLAMAAFGITLSETFGTRLLIMLLLGATLIVGVKKLKYREMAILNNGMIIPIYQRWLAQKVTLLALGDILFIASSGTVTYFVIRLANPEICSIFNIDLALILMVMIQSPVLWITGLYRETILQIGGSNAIKIISSVFYSVVAFGAAYLLFQNIPLAYLVPLLVVHFYFLVSLILAMRFAYQILSYLFHRDKPGGKHILIYGVNENGGMLLNYIHKHFNNNYKVLGFLDDNPSLEGKMSFGYPILGSHWKLPTFIRKHRVDFILICEPDIRPDNLKRVLGFAHQNDIVVKTLAVNFVDEKDRAQPEPRVFLLNMEEQNISIN